MVNRVVSMSQDVPKCHDARRVADASRMSSRYLGESGCIEQLPGLFDGVDKVWVSKAAAGQKVHLAAEERLECLEESEELIGEAHGVDMSELYEEIEIAILA